MSISETFPNWEYYRKHLEYIRDVALAAVNPEHLVRSCLSIEGDQLHVFDNAFLLQPRGKVYLVGAGKAGIGMSRAVKAVLGNRINSGVMAVPVQPEEPSGDVEYIVGGHPLPTEGSILAGNRIQSRLENVTEEDTVILLISGGGSALLELPDTGIVLEDLLCTTKLLLRSGATIHEVNTVRRQLSRIKGGGLSRLAAPARVIALILSDVIGDPLSDIASGLTVTDPTTAEDALTVLDKYNLIDHVPEAISSLLKGKIGSHTDDNTGDFNRIYNYIIGNIGTASQAAKIAAEEIGFQAILVSTQLQGEAAAIGRHIAAMLRIVRQAKGEETAPICLIFGGETTVRVTGDGTGGRNQELALSAAIEFAYLEKVALMTLATDGIDGPTPAAGAVVTGETTSNAQGEGLKAADYLVRNDSHSFFTQLDDTIITGSTGTNVNDLVIALVY
jgi:hydroxypyruvate reductase